MNQEKIMKAKMVTAIIISIAAIIAAFIFAGLYFDQQKQNRLTYIEQYEKNLTAAAEEIEKYIDSGADYDLHYNLLLSYSGAARAMVFLVDDYTEQQKAVNEMHYCLVKYPLQMKDKLSETAQAFRDISAHLDKGYDELREIVASVDKLGS